MKSNGNVKETTVRIFRHGVVSKIYAGYSKKKHRMRVNERKGKRKKKNGKEKISNESEMIKLHRKNILLNRCKGISDRGQIMRLITKKRSIAGIVCCLTAQGEKKTNWHRIDESTVSQCIYSTKKKFRFVCVHKHIRTIYVVRIYLGALFPF